MITLLRNEMGMEVVEREIDRTEVYNAEEMFFTGTGVQVAAVTSVDHRKIGTGVMGEVVANLRTLFFDVVRGNNPTYREWNHPVFAEERIGAQD